MKLKYSVTFIKGSFTPQEAKDVLLELITYKINFHSIKNFSSQERYGKPLKGSQKRIEELQASREKFVKLIESAAREKTNLTIDSHIHIFIEK
ncbi:MAG: hypothetical protein ABI267_00805 [Ginsengibacter sp.]